MSNISFVNQFFILFDINNKVGIHRDTYKLEVMRVTSNREVASWQTDRQIDIFNQDITNQLLQMIVT